VLQRAPSSVRLDHGLRHKAHYRRGGLGGMAVKRRLQDVLGRLLAPIRARRYVLARDPDYVMDVLRDGTRRGQEITAAVRAEIHAGLGLFTLT